MPPLLGLWVLRWEASGSFPHRQYKVWLTCGERTGQGGKAGGGKRSFIHGGDDGDKVAEFSGQSRGGNHGVCRLMGLWGIGE